MAFKRSGVRFPSPPYRSRLLEAGMSGGVPIPIDSSNRLAVCRGFAGIAQLVEHNLAKVGVAGSSPVSRSQSRQETQGRSQLSAGRSYRQVAVIVAGWSSLVARRAHNPEVVGSNPTPAIGGQAVRRSGGQRSW